MARLLIASRSMALALRLADVHAIIEHSPDALDRLDPGADVDAVVLDVGDPSVAIATVERLRAAGNLTPVLLVSGYQPEWNDVERLGLTRVQVVPLPITRAALLQGLGLLTGQIVDLATIPATPPAVAEVAEAEAEAAAPEEPDAGEPDAGEPDAGEPDAEEPDGGPAAEEGPGEETPEDGTEDGTEDEDGPRGPSRPQGPWSQSPYSQPIPLVADEEDWGPSPHEPASIGAPGSTLPPPAPDTGSVPLVPDPMDQPDRPAAAVQGPAARRRPLLGGLRGRGRKEPATSGSLTVAPPGAPAPQADPTSPHTPPPGAPQPPRVPSASPPAGSPPAGLPSFPAIDPALDGPSAARSAPPGHQPMTPPSGAIPVHGGPQDPATFDDLVLAQRKQEQEQQPLASTLEQRLDADAAAASLTLQSPTGTIHIVPRTADLVRMLLERQQELYGVGDTAQVLADDVVERADADAAAVLVPDDGVWRVSGGVGLRPLERRLVLEESHWMIAEIASTGRAVLIEDTDIIRTQLAGAPLASWRHLLCVPVPEVRAAVVLARGSEAGPFTDGDLTAVVPTVREAAALLLQAIETRRLSRLLGPLREADPDGRRRY